MFGYLKHDQPGVIQPPQSEFGSGLVQHRRCRDDVADGFVKLQARLKRFAKVAGEMVSLELVERIAVCSASAVAACGLVLQGSEARRSHRPVHAGQESEARTHYRLRSAEMGAPELAIPRKIIYLDRIPMLGQWQEGLYNAREDGTGDVGQFRGVRLTASSNAKEQRAWYVYDFANSAFASTVITLFLGPYLTSLAKAAAGPDGQGASLRHSGRAAVVVGIHGRAVGVDPGPGAAADGHDRGLQPE